MDGGGSLMAAMTMAEIYCLWPFPPPSYSSTPHPPPSPSQRTSLHAQDIGNLANLVSLNASHNNLHTLPVELEEMVDALTALDVSHNKISEYPSNLYVCKKLRELDLSHNLLEKVPLSVGDLELLKVVRQWEVGIGQLTELAKLELSHNRLIEFPLQLDRCGMLTELNLSHNKIEEISGFISSCQRLEKLDVSHNKVRYPPRPVFLLSATPSPAPPPTPPPPPCVRALPLPPTATADGDFPGGENVTTAQIGQFFEQQNRGSSGHARADPAHRTVP